MAKRCDVNDDAVVTSCESPLSREGNEALSKDRKRNSHKGDATEHSGTAAAIGGHGSYEKNCFCNAAPILHLISVTGIFARRFSPLTQQFNATLTCHVRHQKPQAMKPQQGVGRGGCGVCVGEGGGDIKTRLNMSKAHSK